MKLRAKTILGIAFIESIMLIVLVLSNINFLHSSNNDQIKQRAITIASLFAATTKDAVLATDLASLETFVTELLKNPDVVYARVISNGVTLASGGAEAALQQPFENDTDLETVMDEIFDTHAIIQESGHQFGRVELGISVASTNQIIASAWRWATSIATLEVLLVAFFSFILGTWLTRQLTVLKQASKVISDNGPGHQIPVIGNDEVADVARAFNDMSQSLADSYDELNKTLAANKLAAELARSNRITTRAILSSSLDAVITINEKGQVIEFSKKAEEIFGYRHKEVILRPIEELIIPEEYRGAHKRNLQRYIESGGARAIDQRMQLEAVRKDGSRLPIEFSISPIKTSEGVHFASFIRDITDQVAADNQLRLAASAFESHEAIFVADKENNIQQVNQAFTDITGYQLQEVIGQNPRILSSGKHDAEFYQSLWKDLETNDRWEGEIYNRCKNGDILLQRVSISVVRDAQNVIQNYVTHFIDITEQKANEHRLKKARLEAEQASQAKGMFLANMSHEIRTPLTAIIGYTESMLGNDLTEEERSEYLHTVIRNGRHLQNLINVILDLSKIEAQQLEVEQTEIVVPDLLADITALGQTLALEKEIEFTIHYMLPLPATIYSDPTRIKQVLINLIGNATKFTSADGQIRLIVSLDQENEQMMFTLHDTGIGIEEDKIARLFQPFTQEDSSTTRKFGGTGLGLTISKEFVQRLGGEMHVISDKGLGSMFVSTFATGAIEDGQLIHDPDKFDPVRGDLAPLVGRALHLSGRVLVTDDNQDIRQLISLLIRRTGATVVNAENGQEAVERAQSEEFDLVLMDMHMPVMDGLDATAMLRLTGFESPIVMLTANATESDKALALEAGCNDFLTKPVEQDVFFATLKRYLHEGNSDATETEAVTHDLTDDPEFQQLHKTFIHELPVMLGNITEAFAEQDWETLRSQAHQLKGVAGTFGRPETTQIAGAIETQIIQKDYDEVAHLVQKLEQTLCQINP